jgi:phosphotriesterase-related protein
MTVSGPVDAERLGRTLVHEHLVISWPGEEFERIRRYTREEIIARAVDKMAELTDAGFQTFVDPCPIELGRDPELYAEVAQRSGMHVVCTTGFYTEFMGMGLPSYWRARDPEEIAEFYLSELRDGIGSTGIRPGAIKAATGVEVTVAERRMLIGAAFTQRDSGVAIITHTEQSTNGWLQQEVFAEHGADLSRVLVGHQDEQADVAEIRKLAERGTFVGMDRIGHQILAPEVRRADHVAALVKEGFVRNVCLSQDHICAFTAPRRGYWVPPEQRALREAVDWELSNRPYTYLVTDFIPLLHERGVSAEDVETMLVDNPRRLLTGS